MILLLPFLKAHPRKLKNYLWVDEQTKPLAEGWIEFLKNKSLDVAFGEWEIRIVPEKFSKQEMESIDQILLNLNTMVKGEKVNDPNPVHYWLMSQSNRENWFGTRNQFLPQCFIYAKDPAFKNSEYAVYYHILLFNILFQFTDPEDMEELYHLKPIGCMLDFNGFKEEVILKLKSGDICGHCLRSFKEHDQKLFNHYFDAYSSDSKPPEERGELYSVTFYVLDQIRQHFLGTTTFVRGVEDQGNDAENTKKELRIFLDRQDQRIMVAWLDPTGASTSEALDFNNWENTIYALLLRDAQGNMKFEDLYASVWKVFKSESTSAIPWNEPGADLIRYYFFFKKGALDTPAIVELKDDNNEEFLLNVFFDKMQAKFKDPAKIRRFFTVYFSAIRAKLEKQGLSDDLKPEKSKKVGGAVKVQRVARDFEIRPKN